MLTTPRNEASSSATSGDDGARAARESSDERSARGDAVQPGPSTVQHEELVDDSAEHAPENAEQPHACSARTIFENRTEQSVRAENAARVYKPLRKTRSALSTEFDGAMTRLEYTNVQIAVRCGVTEKTVRQWRGRDLQPGEVAKPIPSDMLVHLPDELFQEMYIALRGLRVAERQTTKVVVR